MPGKNRLLARLIASSDNVTPDSDFIRVNTGKTLPTVAGITTYANIDLLPLSASTGEKALVLSTNSLYIYNNGWYKIAIINNFNPQWVTQPDGTYSLGIDGSTTTITVLASDSDDVPITYTAVGDSDFNLFATATHDSDKHNVWTITPTDSESGSATNRTGVLTFKASDGVNFVQANSTFSISFTVVNSSATVMLLKADSDSADDQVDTSSNAHTITQNGNIKSSAFTPYHPGKYSVLFNSEDAYVTVPAATGSEYRLGNGYWTLEFWIRSIDFSLAQVVWIQRNQQHAMGNLVSITTAGLVRFYHGDGNNIAWEIDAMSCGTITLNKWHHIAIVRNGNGSNNYTTYLDGTQVSQQTWTGTPANRQVVSYIGGGKGTGGTGAVNHTDNREFVGYLKDFRYTESAVYTGNFTAPTQSLTVLPDTKLLLFNGEPYVVDKCNVYGQATATSNTYMDRISPYDYNGYSKTNHGGSVYFDGTDDGLSFGDTTTVKFLHDKTVNYTIECWIYPTDSSTRRTIFSTCTSSSASGVLLENNSGSFRYVIYTGSSGVYTLVNGPAINLRTWQHVAITFDGSSIRTFVNGVLDSSNVTTWSASGSTSNSLYAASIGMDTNGVIGDMYGYISDFRIVNGSVVYDSDFVAPISPLTAISGTEILTGTNKRDIWDISGYSYFGQKFGSAGNMRASAITRKFTSSDSLRFITDGYYRVSGFFDRFKYVTDPCTIEGWVRTFNTSITTFDAIFAANRSSNGDNQLILGMENGQWTVHYSANAKVSAGSYSANTWYHFAIVLNDGTANKIEVYIDGTSIYSNTGALDVPLEDCDIAFGAEFDSANEGSPGNYFGGYMQDLRVSDVARYTSNFTPPTETFTG